MPVAGAVARIDDGQVLSLTRGDAGLTVQARPAIVRQLEPAQAAR